MAHIPAHIHDILVVHGIGTQRRGHTLTSFSSRFYRGVRWQVQKAGKDPNDVKLFGHFQENRMEVHYEDEVFRLWEISWERSFRLPSPGSVLDWQGLWSSQFLNRAYRQWRGKKSQPQGRGPWSRVWWLPILLLDLTLIFPLAVVAFWLWAANAQVKYQKENKEEIDPNILMRHRFATGLALTATTPLLMGLHVLARLGRVGAALPVVGGVLDKMSQLIELVVVAVLGDILIYIFDPVQASFIRGDLEQAVQEARDLADKRGDEPSIHIVGHSMGSVIAYEAISRSLDAELRKSVKTLCTMGTIMDMVRYVLGAGGLEHVAQARFGSDIPKDGQEKGDYPRWLNFFARNDPATGFSKLLEFGDDAVNRPVCSTSQGHSTYFGDVQGMHRPLLAWIVPDHPVFDQKPPAPPPDCQTSIVKDLRGPLGKFLALILVIAVTAWVGTLYFDAPLAEVADELYQVARDASLPWPLSWLAIGLAWLLANTITLLIHLPGWYVKWLKGLVVILPVWFVLALPSLFMILLRQVEYRVRAPLDKGATLNYWVGALREVGPVYEAALRKEGMWTARDFLTAAARPNGPARLAGMLSMPEDWVMERARQANLMRLRGAGPMVAALLQAANVDSLATCGQQDAGALTRKLKERKDEVGLVSTPTAEQVGRWIESAQRLKDVV